MLYLHFFSLGFRCLFSCEIEIEPFKKFVDFYLETDFQTILVELKMWKEKHKITKKYPKSR